MGDTAGKQPPSYRGVNSEGIAEYGSSIGISNGNFSHQLTLAEFQGDISFYDVQYPYWQFPYDVPIFNVIQIQAAGVYHHQSNLGIVGRPRGINDWNTPLQTPYGVLPDELQ
jgi:hypothetical protein